MYINSSGTTNAQGQSVGFETEAFAIADCMKYVHIQYDKSFFRRCAGICKVASSFFYSHASSKYVFGSSFRYIRPPVHTICLGQAYGAAAMLLSQGSKGHRVSLPNAAIMLHQPRSQARGQASDIAIKAREVCDTFDSHYV